MPCKNLISMKLTIHTDGASKGNPGPMHIGVAIYEGERLVRTVSESAGTGTNNNAEYLAVIRALDEAKALGASEIELRSDSQLLVRQLNGQYKVRSANILPLFEKVREKKRFFSKISFIWTPREENVLADALSNGKNG